MYTYIIKSHDLYKIGKAVDVDNRIKGFKTGNPFIEHVKTIEGNYESYLHKHYKQKRVRGEWFKLDSEDIGTIDILIEKEKQNKVINNIEEAKTKKQIREDREIIEDELDRKRRERDRELQSKTLAAWQFAEHIMNDIITISIGKSEEGKITITTHIWDESRFLVLNKKGQDNLIESVINNIKEVIATRPERKEVGQ